MSELINQYQIENYSTSLEAWITWYNPNFYWFSLEKAKEDIKTLCEDYPDIKFRLISIYTVREVIE